MSNVGLYGPYGGRYVPETLIPALDELEAGWREALDDPSYRAELEELGRTYAGRPTPLTPAARFAPGRRIYLKREDLLHTGAHKLHNALGQAVIGREAREQMLAVEGRLPEAVVACVGGGSNAIGIFFGFVDDPEVRLVGVEAAGAASLGKGRPGVLHGARSSLLADEDGQILDAHSISAGLDYPGVGPEHAYLRDTGRAEYVSATDEEALAAFRKLTRTEGIIPALEPAHALARAADLDAGLILVCLSGRGDKDLAEVLER